MTLISPTPYTVLDPCPAVNIAISFIPSIIPAELRPKPKLILHLRHTQPAPITFRSASTALDIPHGLSPPLWYAVEKTDPSRPDVDILLPSQSLDRHKTASEVINLNSFHIDEFITVPPRASGVKLSFNLSLPSDLRPAQIHEFSMSDFTVPGALWAYGNRTEVVHHLQRRISSREPVVYSNALRVKSRSPAVLRVTPSAEQIGFMRSEEAYFKAGGGLSERIEYSIEHRLRLGLPDGLVPGGPPGGNWCVKEIEQWKEDWNTGEYGLEWFRWFW